MGVRRRMAVLVAVAAVGGATGLGACGSDDESTITDPEPVTTSEPSTTTSEPETTESTTTEDDGGVEAEPGDDSGGHGGNSGTGGTGSFDPAKPDSPQNDVPPQPGAQESFEQFCDENPGACG
jgi:hypothetical protein